MDRILDILDASLRVWNGTALYVLVGFLLAGLMHAFNVGRRMPNVMRRPGLRGVGLSALIGIPLPLCSCGVLPTAIALRRQGASRGSMVSFLIATPETSIPSMLITYGLLGPVLLIWRPIAAFLTAIAAGLAVDVVERDTNETPSTPAVPLTVLNEPPQDLPDTILHEPKQHWARSAYHFAFVDLLDDIAGWLLFGVIVAGIIQAAMPDFIMDLLFGSNARAMLIMLVIGIPLYVCATSSTPIAAALIAQGVSPGAALVFLLAGPATNAGSIGVLIKQLGRKTVGIYLAAVAIVAVLMGLLLNGFLAWRAIDVRQTAQTVTMGSAAWYEWLGSIIMAMLIVLSFRRTKPGERFVAWLNQRAGLALPRQSLRWAIVIAAILAYAASGLFTVQPGQVGIIKLFGRVQGQPRQPGLHYAAPYPIASVDRVAVDQVRRITIGFAEVDETAPAPAKTQKRKTNPNPENTRSVRMATTESSMLSGDENILDIQAIVHFNVRPDAVLPFAYGTADPAVVVKGLAQAVLREAIAAHQIDAVLTTTRADIETDLRNGLQTAVDRADCGVHVVAFQLVSVHAPAEVHAAFRDVASAVEDKQTTINLAYVSEARMIPNARGQAQQQLDQATAYAQQTVNNAQGQADRFTAFDTAYKTARNVTRMRLLFETLDRTLPNLAKYIKPPASANTELEIWFLGGAIPTQPQLNTTARPSPPATTNEQPLNVEDLKELIGP